jgi:hypothetical protein
MARDQSLSAKAKKEKAIKTNERTIPLMAPLEEPILKVLNSDRLIPNKAKVRGCGLLDKKKLKCK